MAQHGYLDDGFGSEYDPEYDASDDRRDRDMRGQYRHRDRDWRGSDRGRMSRDDDRRGFMFDRSGDPDRQRDRSGGHEDDRGFFSRIGDESRSWFSDDSSGGRSHSDRDYGRDQASFRGRGGWQTGQDRQRFSNHPDDHYRSWRDKQMQSLDNDYADYCREREQQFHSEFDSWRNKRYGNQEPLRTGMTQTAQTGDPTGELELTRESSGLADEQPDPMATATLGTNSSGRNKRG